MALLGKAAILGADDLPTRDIDVPEWGGTVRIRAITARDRDAFEAMQIEARQDGRIVPENVRAHYVAACIIDEAGNLVFDADDVIALGRKSSLALNRVFVAIGELNQLGADAVEDAAKN